MTYAINILHMKDKDPIPMQAEQLISTLAALANPHRLRIVAALARSGRDYVSRLAREIGISRPLLHLHLQKLEEARLVRSKLELSADGKALNFFELVPFEIALTPDLILAAADSLGPPSPSTPEGD